ncbi:MAG TPA: hypothetical protein VJ583_04810 [Nitrososphaeraceae archaeon]|nr:hypothetical protein [Nitrososphaeraceae archaeon]
MNNKLTSSTKKSSAIFLATILIAGIIALSFPSFMTGSAQAQPYYGMDNNYQKIYGKDNIYKSKDSVDIKKIKCNNINININTGNATDGNGDNGNTTNGNGNTTDGVKKIKRDGFTFICINNNNNEAGAGGNVTEPEPETCEECFTTILTGEELNDLISGTVLFTTLEELCNFIDTNFENESQRLFISQYLFDAADDVGISAGISAGKINSILDCLEEIYGVDFPRP